MGPLSLYEGSEDGIFPLNSPDSISLIQVLEISANKCEFLLVKFYTLT